MKNSRSCGRLWLEGARISVRGILLVYKNKSVTDLNR